MGTTLPPAGGPVIRVLIVSPTSGSRRALEHVVAQDPGLVLLPSSDSPESPDVILLDSGPQSHLSLPVLLGQGPSRDAAPVVALLEDLDGEAGVGALRAGARAVLSRHASPQEIRAAVRAAAAGLASLPAALATAVLDDRRSEERRVGKECRARWAPDHEQENRRIGSIEDM